MANGPKSIVKVSSVPGIASTTIDNSKILGKKLLFLKTKIGA